ncbi:MAG: ABC transporter ATP-binding protein [Treponema sp.]
MTKISTYLKRNTNFYIIVLISLLINVVLDMVSPQITRMLIDDVIIAKRMELLTKLLGFYILIGVIHFVFDYTKEFSGDYAGSKIACLIRKELFHFIQKLSANFFDKTNAGELMSRVKDDVDRVWDSMTYITMLLVQVTVHTAIILYCMFSMSWQLAIVPAVGMFLAGTIAVFMEKKLGKVYGDIEQENSILNNVASENLAGVRTVKSFAREKFEIKKFLSHNTKYYELNVQQSRVFVKYYPLLQVITVSLPCIVLIQGGFLVMNDKFTIGELSAFIQYSMNITWPMEMLGWLMNGLSSGIAAWKRIKKIYAEVPEIKEDSSPTVLSSVKGDVEFDHVNFTRNSTDILKDISFHIKPGCTLGIMGETGSGKSSIGNLLSRMYDVTGGEIKIDGVDIRKLKTSQLRQNVAPITQEVFLFSNTITENLLFGKKELLSKVDIQKAASQADATEFIDTLPEQYETVIGERGVGLSGGQKQRLTIARAIAKKTPVIVFDDSTSALDMETEQKLQSTIEEMNGVTKIIIAHRISAVRNADEIIVLKEGQIAERGTHEQLLEKKGLYYETYESQYGSYELLKKNA